MNYGGNMPDWHQYNPPQSGINDVTSTAQNVNSGHLSFISSISPTCPTQLNGLNLSTEGLEKHQNDPNFNPRHFQPHLSGNISHGHNAADNNPLASMVQMQNCIGHYGPSNTRNPMVDNLNGSMDPRSAAIGGMNEELGYRNNQVPLSGPISHLNGPNVMNMNASHASMGSRNTNVNSHAAGRTGPPPSFVPCKGLCCNPDPNMSYQQYCSYQNNATTYRENIRTSTGYQTDARRYGNEYNFRKDNFDGKEVLSPMVPPPNGPPNADHRRNFSDFKYRKDRLLSRSYPSSSGMVQNYTMQNYNYTGEYQKYSYNVKEYSKMSGVNVANQGMVKHSEQGFTMPQQKYNNKQVPYQTGGAIMPTSMPSTSVPNPSMMPPAQNTYFNSQYPKNMTTDASHDCQEAADNASMVNRMQTSATMHTPSNPRFQMYQQKIAMQRFSMENHLRELARIPGYQSHPKYKECVHKYREILKLQQSVTYQGQIQQNSCVAASTVNTSAIPPINLQFDQNGVLISSNYMSEAFPRVQQAVNSQQMPVDKQGKQDGSGVPEMMNRTVQKPEQLVPQQHDGNAAALCAESVQKQDRYLAQKNLDHGQFQVQKTGGESFNNLAGNASNAVIQQKMSKEFADKPELDVRQFLANWDESEDEDGAAGSNLPSAVSNSTPVVVVGYENVNLSAKTLEGLEVAKPNENAPSMITFENQEKSDIGVVPAQDCLTIAYSSAENVELAKDPACKDIAKEAIVRSGSHIIQCISNGPDEVPTIHIVDNLEIGSILQVTNGQVTDVETLGRQDAVSFFQEGTEEVATTAITLTEADKFKKTDGSSATDPATTEYSADLGNLSKEEYVVKGPSLPKTAESTPQTSRVGDQGIAVLPTSAKDSARDANLKKQNSFASEESHNPDDISLPDLPTSECTPISTTLNTPIHSDNEESSERVEDLTIPTNPIEIIQNSPMISFTQSPTKGEPYDHLESEGTVRNKPADSLGGEYQTENRFKNNKNDKNVLGHDAILDTFEFSANTDKNGSTGSDKSGKERANLNETTVSPNNREEIFALDNESETVEATSMHMTLTSGEYELKIVSTEAQNKSSVQAYRNLTCERRANESQAASLDARKNSQGETNAKVAPRYSGSIKVDSVSQNVTINSDPGELDDGQVDVNYSRRRRVSIEMTRQTVTSGGSSSPARSSRAGDGCATQIVKNNSPTSHGAKHLALDRDADKLEKAKANEDSSTERSVNDNRSGRIDAADSKSSRHVKLADRKKSSSIDQAVSHKKRCLLENTAERCGETIVHHNKHTQEAATHKEKSCTVEDLKGPDNSHNKPKVIESVNITDSGERMRLLKEYRRIKYKSHSVSKVHDKEGQEVSDYAASKKCHRSSNPNERATSQPPRDNQLCQKNVARSKSSEEQEGKCANILKTFVTKNINPDFAIQVTNVNLKLNDDDHQKRSQHLREEAKSGGSLDGIKIEINVSCTERNTTEKLLHENIKNAVAETIGHLTNSISNGARSNSTSITEIQGDKKMICDKTDCREKRNRSPSAATEASAYNEAHDDHNNTRKSVIACKEDTNGETLVSKRRSSLSEQELTNDVYEDSGNVNAESELVSSASKSSKSEHAVVRRRSLHQDVERKVAATSLNSEELKASSNNSSYIGSRNVNVQKKEYQETAVISSACKSARNFQDDAASKLNAVPSTSSGTVESSMEDASYDNPVHFDYNHFDVAPNESADAGDRRHDRWKRPKRDDGRYGNFDLYETTSGYVNPTFFSADELENLNTVPVYTTKDGKITYSPNPRFTYRELIMEARTKDDYVNSRESHFARSPSYDYYNCSKLRKVDFKRNRDVTTVGRKKESDPAEANTPAAKHVDYLSNKNTAHKNANCAITRGTSHLEFFNDDANKLYANKCDQETKETNKKNIVDLDFLEKQYNLDNESASCIKHCKTKILADNLEKRYNESSVFDSNLFLEPRATCWEETMESIKSYSSHIDRRKSDNVKELNFSEIFAAQKRLDPFPFLPPEQDSSDNGNRKANCDVTNETLHHTTCNYADNVRSVRDDDSRCEQSDAASCNEQENEYNNECNQNITSADVGDKSISIFNASLSMQSNDKDTKKQESQFAEDESSAIEFAERARSYSPKITNEKVYDPEEDQCSTGVKDKEASTEHQVEDDSHLRYTETPKEDKTDAEVANTKEVSDEESAKVASPSKLNIESKDSLDEPKDTETIKESALASNERDDKINYSTKDDSDYAVNQKIVYQQVLSDSIDHKDKDEITPATESNISAKINLNQEDEQDAYDKKDRAISKEDEPSALQIPSDVAFVEQVLDEEGNEHQSGIENEGQKAEISLTDRGNDEVDTCSTVISTPAIALNLQTEENVCDLFACEEREQNISEFTVIKNIIKGDKKPSQELENESPKDCDSIIDSKLLCMDSSDCGIYVEDRCTLAQMSEHDFTEDDSMVPMVWETSQIQEDAVNRLCSIDESIDFAGAVNSLQDPSLLDHLSLSRMSALKEPRVMEITAEIESKAAIDESTPMVESAVTTEESKTTSSNDEDKEQSQISSSSYEKIAYLRATDCNANTKIVPKLVIKKSETSSKFVTKVGSSSVIQDSIANKSVCQPKIPKMIIRNVRSRPATPSIESVHEETPSQISISDRTSLTNEDLYESNSESSLHELNSYRNKIPKMKIKLDDKHSNKIVRADDEEICVKRKNMKKTIPKVKIKSTSRSDLTDNSVCNSMTSQEPRDPRKYEEKIPILKLKKQERNRSSSPEVTRKRQSSSHSEVPIKKCRRSERNETEHHTRRSNSSDSTRTNASECEAKKNPLICISEKIPKVIIKRTSASAEFKCELSKGYKNVIAKSAKWQPEVKLERYRILDSMVKDLKLTLSPITLRAIDKMSASRKDDQKKQGDYKLSRSNSTSDLLPAKSKERRMSDYDCRKINDASRIDINFVPSQDADSRDAKTCTTPKKNASSRGYKSTDVCQKDNKRRSRSRDNNPRSETDVTLSDKETNQLSERANSQEITSQCDKHKTDSFDINREQTDDDIILNKYGHPSFKFTLKESKATTKMETCFAKLPEEVNLRTDKEQRKDQDDDPFSSKDDGEVVIKKERLSSSSDMDNDCTLQDGIDLLKDDSASVLDNFEVDKSTVIKVESSDESQSTIEILPASPINNHGELERHMIEDGDSEQLYSADAIPTQFELELEITDNSNPDLLDIAMPKLDPITCYNSRRVLEESCNQAANLERYDKFEAFSRDKNSLGKDGVVEIDTGDGDRSALENSSTGFVKEISKTACCKAAGFAATRDNFCCNDSLIKEVLAAKETLKKCLSKSRYDVQSSAIGNARPKTAAEKKQGSSFDINRLSEAPASDASQGCHSDVTPPNGSTPVANKHKTENISNAEKSDKKHSKLNKSSFVKKKSPRSPEKNEADSKGRVKDTPECNTISLKTFKQLNQTVSDECLTRTVHLNEKRKNITGRSDDVLHSQDSQRKEKNRISSYKIPKISRSTDQENNASNAREVKPKEDNMPILEPEVDVNFDTNSDRESSRSPPVITIQDSGDLGIAESKLVDDKIITSCIKVESNTKDVKKSEMSIVDLITELAYHEKATIKHRRYCNLCERWFPTTSRHRRHLAGYQHRHIELTQRRSIHALFTLFTGKPCPRLVPANLVRNDCSVGELTPLQIAVQDVTKSFDRTQESPRKENDVEK